MNDSGFRGGSTAVTLLVGIVIGITGARLWPVAEETDPAPDFRRKDMPEQFARPPAPGNGAASVESPTIPDGGPTEWMAALERLRVIGERDRFLHGVVDLHARTRFDDVLDFLRKMPPGARRNAAWEHALLLLREQDAPRALQLARTELPGIEGTNAQIALLQQWGAVHPPEALAWAAQQTEPEQALLGVEQVIAAAARVDPQQARGLLENAGLPPEQWLTGARALAGTWAQTEPEQAIAWVRAQSATAATGDALAIAYLNWAAADPARAARTLAADDPALVPEVAERFANLWAAHDPGAAVEWLSKIPPSAERSDALGEVGEIWSRSDGAAALAWARQLPAEDAARALAVRSVALAWSRHDPAGFALGLAALSGPERAEVQALLLP